MDVDTMTVEDRQKHLTEGLCFKCHQQGHLANDPQFHPKNNYNRKKPWTPKYTPPQKQKAMAASAMTRIQALIAELDEEEAEKFDKEFTDF